jgi:hypothetical protein
MEHVEAVISVQICDVSGMLKAMVALRMGQNPISLNAKKAI